jgi:alpha-beta hydrolase superfamily lysophospholipase
MRTESVRVMDGMLLLQRTWPLRRGAARRGSVLLVHGLGEHSGRYAHVAKRLNELGLVVRSYDHRGFGGSGGAKGTIPSPSSLLADAAQMFDRLRSDVEREGDSTVPFLIGHSMGGCVVARGVTGWWIVPRGMVLSSPALMPRMRWWERVGALVGGRVTPNLRLPHGLPMDKLSRDPAVLEAVHADTLMHDRVTPRLVRFMIEAGRTAIRDAPSCKVPTLLLVAGSDELVQPEGAVEFYQRLPGGVGTLRVYPELYHEVFNERPDDRAVVLDDLAEWLEGQMRSGGAQRGEL